MTYLIMTIAGLFGIAFHVLIMIKKTNESLPLETFKSVFNEYLKKDKWCLVGSVLTVLFAMFVIAPQLNMVVEPDATGDKEDWLIWYLVKYIRVGFATLAYFGDSVIYGAFGVVGKKLGQKGIDIATQQNAN